MRSHNQVSDMPVLTHFPKTRLSELVGRFGGISRSDAIAEARKELEAMRHESDGVIEGSISLLEEIISAPAEKNRYSDPQLRQILCFCDQIVTLAGTFDYIALDKVTRSLCDVADGLLRTGRKDVASVQVHMRAMRMVSPKAPLLEQEQVDQMLFELGKILKHHGFTHLSDAADQAGLEIPSDETIAPAQAPASKAPVQQALGPAVQEV